MTARRFNTSPTLSPSRTGGDDRPRPACLGKSEPYDVLTDLTAGPAFEAARREARNICGSCPLFATCLRENRGEPWARALLGLGETPMTRSGARTSGNYHAERNEARRADLRHLLASGAGIDEVCARLHISRKGLEKWCRNHARAEWLELVPPVPERIDVGSRRSIPFDVSDEVRAAHSAFVRGIRTGDVIEGERAYQRARSRHRRDVAA